MMDIFNSFYSYEYCYHFESSDSDSYDEEYDTSYYYMYSNGFDKKLIQRDIENKEENILDLELFNKNTYSSKLKSHSIRVKLTRESVCQCKKVLAAILDKDYKDILYTFNHDLADFSSLKFLAKMWLHQISSVSYTEKLTISNILNKRTEYIERNTTKAMHVDYLDLFFRKNLVTEQCFDLISRILHFYLDIKNALKYSFCKNIIKMVDKEEEQQRIIKQTILLLFLLILITSINSDGHHKSAKLKKYLSLKYEYDGLVLYLLWCSGDVEINPGPTFSKMRSMHASEKERKWICEVCSVLVKLLKKLPETSKPKTLWKEKPTYWPKDEPFFDPYNKSKVQNDDLLSNESLLNCLINCCDENEIYIPETYRNEINLFVNNNKSLLFETYIFRREKHNICEALSNLLMCKDQGEKINQYIKSCGITLNFDFTQTSQNSRKTKRKAEIVTNTRRDLAVLFCKIIKGRPIHEKCDGLWKIPPLKWPTDEPFYSPHNGKNRQGSFRDNELVDNLIKYCQSNSIVIPPQYQDMVTAWTERHMDELITIHTIYANIAKIEHALKYLQIEGILSKPDILDILKKAGLILDTDKWRLDDKKTDENQIASRKRFQKLVVNPITSVDTAVKKSSSCDKGDRQFLKLIVSKKTSEDSRNTLLSTTDKTSVDADSLCSDSTYTRKNPLKLTESEEFNSQKRKLNTTKLNRKEHEITKKQKVDSSLSETYVPSTQEEEDKLKIQLEEPIPPLSEASKKCCPTDFDNILNSLLNCRDLENYINVNEY